MKEKILEYKGNTYKHGDFIVGYISNTYCFGKLCIKNNDYYFCQNSMSGLDCKNKLGYNYSWFFDKISTTQLSDSVEILNKLNNNGYHTYLKEQKTNLQSIFKNLNLNKDQLKNDKLININSFTICMIMNHPDCCGSQILYNFCDSNKLSYSKYKDLKESDYDTIKKHLFYINKAAKIAHIASYQVSAKKFLEKLGFEEKYSYENPKSKNIIHVYHYLN